MFLRSGAELNSTVQIAPFFPFFQIARSTAGIFDLKSPSLGCGGKCKVSTGQDVGSDAQRIPTPGLGGEKQGLFSPSFHPRSPLSNNLEQSFVLQKAQTCPTEHEARKQMYGRARRGLAEPLTRPTLSRG